MTGATARHVDHVGGTHAQNIEDVASATSCTCPWDTRRSNVVGASSRPSTCKRCRLAENLRLPLSHVDGKATAPRLDCHGSARGSATSVDGGRMPCRYQSGMLRPENEAVMSSMTANLPGAEAGIVQSGCATVVGVSMGHENGARCFKFRPPSHQSPSPSRHVRTSKVRAKTDVIQA
ncbi:hypothetical protein J1614_008588 [Plenodomus biglobosus]|nr:hypothetical protein J1614_008588 [Plenodomus biglobosus]